jgi:DNA invertase Pin-like site-specific DNA recombinase
MRAVVYLRVSSEEQNDSKLGLEAQEHDCRIWAQQHRYKLAGPYQDDGGVSGDTPLEKRPGLMSAIAELEKGDVLLVAKRDRLARGGLLMALAEAAVKIRGSRVASAAGEGTLASEDSESDLILRTITDLFAQLELVKIRARTRAALQAKRIRGERLGAVPYGYAPDESGPRHEESGQPLRLIPEPREQETLTQIRGLAARGQSDKNIADFLNAFGIKAKRGGKWYPNVVKAILARERKSKCAEAHAPA